MLKVVLYNSKNALNLKSHLGHFFFSRRVVIQHESDMPLDFGTTPGGTIFGTTPGGEGSGLTMGWGAVTRVKHLV